MKRLHLDVRIFAALVALAAAVFLATTAPGETPASLPAPAIATLTPTTAPVRDDVDAGADAERSRRKGMESALAGKFEEARRCFQQAGDTKALQLLDEYVRKHRRDEAGRVAEYAATVRRVQQCMLAQASIAALADDKPIKELRGYIESAAEAWSEMVTASQTLELATPEELSELKDKAEVKLKEAAGLFTSASKFMADRSDKYSETFRSALGEARIALANLRKSWAGVSADGDGRRHREVMSLQLEMESLGELMGEIESMITAKPWRRALTYGQIAVDLSLDSDRVMEQQWYKELVADTEARGRNADSRAKARGKDATDGESEWYDALTAYNGLARLAPDNQAYKDSVKIAERHVRVMELYGKKPNKEATTQPDNGQRTWREIVARVDKDMISKAISLLATYYVTAVDYRKVTEGALRSIKVLVETPQAANAFPGLKDDHNVRKMIESIDAGLANIKKRDRVDEMDLLLALSEVVSASERTVKIPIEVLAMEFADGFLNELDRFSSMIWPYEMEDFEKNTMGRFFGIGVQINKVAGQPLKVVTPLAGAPAYEAGIRAGDSIIAVKAGGDEWVETKDLTVDGCVKKIMGAKGTKVVLKIRRRGSVEPIDFEVIRDEIRIHTVSGWRRLENGGWDYMLDKEDGIGYVRIRQFTDTTSDDLAKALEDLHEAGMKSLVLDLRSNPGGLLSSAAEVANEFLASGKIVSTKGRAGQRQPMVIRAKPGGAYLKGDLIVLVDQYSASAAEIVSGALKELGRAVVVGRRTYGKGSVQNVIGIPEHQASLKLTTAYYYVGNDDKLVHRRNGATEWGVSPHVVARMTPHQSRKWLSIRNRTDLIQEVDSSQLTEDLASQFDSDISLRTAVLLLKLRETDNARTPT